ncbi:hypothetical protein Tco_1314006 [Tanacetum coccineum]
MNSSKACSLRQEYSLISVQIAHVLSMKPGTMLESIENLSEIVDEAEILMAISDCFLVDYVGKFVIEGFEGLRFDIKKRLPLPMYGFTNRFDSDFFVLQMGGGWRWRVVVFFVFFWKIHKKKLKWGKNDKGILVISQAFGPTNGRNVRDNASWAFLIADEKEQGSDYKGNAPRRAKIGLRYECINVTPLGNPGKITEEVVYSKANCKNSWASDSCESDKVLTEFASQKRVYEVVVTRVVEAQNMKYIPLVPRCGTITDLQVNVMMFHAPLFAIVQPQLYHVTICTRQFVAIFTSGNGSMHSKKEP